MKIFPRVFLVAAIAAVSMIASNSTRAQNIDLSTDQVTVDLSVIEGSGSGASTAPYMTRTPGLGAGRGLLLPGTRNPVSKLHVPTPKGTARIKLRKPGTKPKKKVARKAPPAKKTKPAVKKPVPPTVAAVKPPEPKTAMPPKAAPKPVAKAEPKPAPMPKPAKQEAKVAPPAPPPVQKPAVAKVPEPVKPAPPVVAAKPKPEVKKTEQAAVSPAPKTTQTGRALQVAFAATASKLPASSKDGLKALALKLKGKETLRLQLMAYAGGKSLSSSKARRMSLSRALSVRSYLIENGIRSTRIDVRALGSKTTEKPLNRVDVNIVER